MLDITAATTLRLTARVTLLPAAAVTLKIGLLGVEPVLSTAVAPLEGVTAPAYSIPCGRVISTSAVFCPPPS